jgi:hypothetical protein
MKRIPNNYPIAIDIENFPSLSEKIAIITNTTDKSRLTTHPGSAEIITVWSLLSW